MKKVMRDKSHKSVPVHRIVANIAKAMTKVGHSGWRGSFLSAAATATRASLGLLARKFITLYTCRSRSVTYDTV